MDNIEYKNIVENLKNVLDKKELMTINELHKEKVLSSLNYEDFRAIMKLLIDNNNIIIIDSINKKFEDYSIAWNKEKDIIEIPYFKKDSNFKDVKICVTLPRFNVFGLTDFFNYQQIQINTLLEEFNLLFNSANEIIRICSPFIEWDGFNYFKDVLLEKVQQGIKIKILCRELYLKKKETINKEIKKIFEIFKYYHLEKNVEIRNYHFLTEDNKLACSIHAKMIIIDDIKAYIGSGEIRKNSLKKNLEIGVILAGEKVKDLKTIYDGIYYKSEVLYFE